MALYDVGMLQNSVEPNDGAIRKGTDEMEPRYGRFPREMLIIFPLQLRWNNGQ